MFDLVCCTYFQTISEYHLDHFVKHKSNVVHMLDVKHGVDADSTHLESKEKDLIPHCDRPYACLIAVN